MTFDQWNQCQINAAAALYQSHVQSEPQEPPHDADLDGFTPPSEIVCGTGTIEKNG